MAIHRTTVELKCAPHAQMQNPPQRLPWRVISNDLLGRCSRGARLFAVLQHSFASPLAAD